MAQSEITNLRDDDYILLDKEGRRTISGRFLKQIIAAGGGGGGEFEVSWDNVTGKPTFGALASRDNVTSTQIVDGTIVNADVSTSAAIAATKSQVAAGTSGLTAGNLQTTIQNIFTRLGGVTIVALTQAQYDAIATKDPNTLYVVT